MLIESRSFAAGQDAGLERSFDQKTSAGAGKSLQIDVGLVNNMADSALAQTERQFRNLLELGAGEGLCVRLHLLSMDAVARGPDARAHMRGRYVDVMDAKGLSLDALIVTGAEPRAKSLRDESYWLQFAHLMDWAEKNTFSTICSCLAAHAAVLHFDQIERYPIGVKRSGLFESETSTGHPISRNLESRVLTPHSRYNEIREEDLRRAGYQILTNSPRAGVDMFMKTQGKCMFLCFQGHPEYESFTLLREYRRDVLRYLNGERDEYPIMPFNYFDAELERRLGGFETRARARRSAELASELPLRGDEKAIENGAPGWAAAAATIYRNWLNYIVEAKQRERIERSVVECWC